MFLRLSNLKFRDEFDRIIVFFVLHSFLFLLAKFYELLKFEFNFLSVVGFVLWCLFYRLFYRMIKKLYYTYWTLSGIALFSAVEGMFSCFRLYDDVSLFYLYILSIVCLGIASYMVFTPIYYPIVSWWEYDFRYRNDVRTTVKFKENEDEGRLIDIRRGAGGLSFFENLNIGEVITLIPKYNEMETLLKAEVVSKRQISIGRPYTYGLKFHFNSEEEEKNFYKFQNFWQFERKHKQNVKFKAKTS